MNVRTVILAAQPDESQHLEHGLSALRAVEVARKLSHYPDEQELRRMLRAIDPDLMFLSTSSAPQMETLVSVTAQNHPNTQIVLLDSGGQVDTLRSAMRLGVRECLSVPFQAEDIRAVIERSMTRRQSAPATSNGTNNVFCFLPARPGTGATVLATQTALHLSAEANGRCLLLDADLDAGLTQFLLQMKGTHSLVDALERFDQLDEEMWPVLVSRRGNLDLIAAGDSNDDYRPDLERLQRVIGFARRQYATILIDLPSAINRLSVELMQQSKAVFLVSTTDVASLHMARRRVAALGELQLTDQLRLIVNRVEKNGLPLAEVAKAVGIPIHASFPDDYARVQEAILAGDRVSTSHAYGRQVKEFAATLPRETEAALPAKRHRYLEMFKLPRMRQDRWGS